MAFQTFVGAGLWFPGSYTNDMDAGSGLYVVDAAAKKAVLVVQCPKAGILDRFDANVSAVSSTPDVRFSFQGVDLTTGLANGTILATATGNKAFTTYTALATTGWKSNNFTEPVTVTRGQLIACVIDIPTWVTPDTVTMTYVVTASTSGSIYGISDVSTKTGNHLLVVALHYTDGYAYVSEFLPAVSSMPYSVFNVGSSPDEIGIAFQFPVPVKLGRVAASIALTVPGADFEVKIYDSNGTTVLSTTTWDGNASVGANNVFYEFVLQSELTLTKDTTYRATLRPTTAGDLAIRHMIFENAALMLTVAGGANIYSTTRVDSGGSWTDYNASSPGFRRHRMFLHVTALDDGVGGGGGGGSYGMVG